MDHLGTPLHLSNPVFVNNLSWSVLDELQAKHPSGQPASEEALLSPSSFTTSFHPIVFDALDGEAIRCTALCTRGTAGPSGVDNFCGKDYVLPFVRLLCSSLALVARHLCTEVVFQLLWHVV